jgi:hypothetical protein
VSSLPGNLARVVRTLLLGVAYFVGVWAGEHREEDL